LPVRARARKKRRSSQFMRIFSQNQISTAGIFAQLDPSRPDHYLNALLGGVIHL